MDFQYVASTWPTAIVQRFVYIMILFLKRNSVFVGELSQQNAAYPYQVYNDEDDLVRQIHERLSQAFPELNRN